MELVKLVGIVIIAIIVLVVLVAIAMKASATVKPSYTLADAQGDCLQIGCSPSFSASSYPALDDYCTNNYPSDRQKCLEDVCQCQKA